MAPAGALDEAARIRTVKPHPRAESDEGTEMLRASPIEGRNVDEGTGVPRGVQSINGHCTSKHRDASRRADHPRGVENAEEPFPF